MKISRWFFITLLLCLSSFLSSALSANEIAAPDPARLKSDWWGYFAPETPLSDEDLEKRVTATDKQLKQIEKTLNANTRREILPSIIQLRELLVAYRSRRGEEAAAVKPLDISQENYTLDEVFSLQNTYLELSSEVEYESSDIAWRRDLIAAERKQQSQRKVSYLEGSRTDADQLALGVALMSSRLQMELDLQDLNNRQKRLEQLLTQKAELQKELKDIAERLVLKEENKNEWNNIRKQALDAAVRIRNESISDETGHVINEGGFAAQNRRLDSMRVMHRELRITTEELRAVRAELVSSLIDQSIGKSKDTDAHKALLQTAEQQIDNIQPKKKYWKSSIEGINSVRMEQTETAGTKSGEEKISLETTKLVSAIKKDINDVDHELELLTFTIELSEKRMQLGESNFKKGWALALDYAGDVFENMNTVFVASLFEVNETPVTLLGLLRVIIIVMIAWGISRGARSAIKHLSEKRSSVSQSSIYALTRVIHYVILSLGVVIGLSSIGVDFTKFALLASALSIGIGFGLQTLVSNFVAGLIILFEKSMKVGDFVELESGITGEVQEINMRSTLITTNDNIDILVPNSEFINKNVTNWTMRDAYRRVHIKFGVAYGSNKDLVKKAVLEAADNVSWTLKSTGRRAPQVWLVNFGESSLDFELVIWLKPEATKRPSAVQATYLWEIESKLTEYNIEIPFPQRDLHLRSGFESVPVKI